MLDNVSDPRLLLGRTGDCVTFVEAILGPGSYHPCEGIGFLRRDGVLEAAAIYHGWTPDTGVIEISAASISRRWGTRSRLHVIFDYPFQQLGCQMVVARTSEHNHGPLRIWRALGADEYRIPRLLGRDHAGIITTLTAEQWAEWKEAHGL